MKKLINTIIGEYKGDERELYEERRADELTGLVFILLSILVIFINYLNSVSYLDILGISFTSIGIGNIFRYKRIKYKKHLISGIIMLILGLLFLYTHIYNIHGA